MSGIKFMGKDPAGLAKAIKTDLSGSLVTQNNDVINIYKETQLVANGTLTSNPINANGMFKIHIKLHSSATFKIFAEYLKADETILETETIVEQLTSIVDSSYDFNPKYPNFRIKIESLYPSNRNVWLTLTRKPIEPFYDMVDIEKTSIIDVFDNVDVLANSSITSSIINSAGYPLKLGLLWSSPTDMRMKLDVEYYTKDGVLLSTEENIIYSNSASGNNKQIVDLLPAFNLFKIKISNLSNTDRKVRLQLSRIKDYIPVQLKRVIAPSVLSRGTISVEEAVPTSAYGLTLLIVVKNYTPNKNISIKSRVTNIFKTSSHTASINMVAGGWETQQILLDGAPANAIIQMSISPEAMYLKEYPYDYTSGLLEVKMCPCKLTTDILRVTVYIEGTDLLEGEGVEYEIVGYWHV